MMTSTVIVLMMTIPGLALFYGGMVRKKNVLSVLMQCFAACCLLTVVWMVVGYSLAFTEGTIDNRFVGGFEKVLLAGIGKDSLSGTIPESVFMTFQMTFFIITPALIVGAIVDRMKFSAFLFFMALWSIIVYAPVCHWVWGGGFLADDGVLDFAGGTVVHINAGIAGLVACLVLGRRTGYPTENMAPHNLTLTVIGASLLWVGWFGFNAGSAVAANGTAGMAMAVTQIATAVAALAWMFSEWLVHGKPSILGIASGAIAGLVAITPAAGFVDPKGALVIGAAAGVGCYICSTGLKKALGYDDSLDVFGGHHRRDPHRRVCRRGDRRHGGTARGQLRAGSDPGLRCPGHRRLECGCDLCHPDGAQAHHRHPREYRRRNRRSRRRAARRVRSVILGGRGSLATCGPHLRSALSPRRAQPRPGGLPPGRFFCPSQASIADRYDRIRGNARQHPLKVLAAQSDAAFGRRISWWGNMQEDGTAAAAHAWALVVARDHDDIVKVVRPPKPLGARRVGVAHLSVVVAVLRGIAPAVVRTQRRHRKQGLRTRHAVGPIEHLPQRETPHRRRAVSLILDRAAPRTPERAGKPQISAQQHSPLVARRQTDHDELLAGLWTDLY
jgi:Amt family ammonium transporter